MLDDVVNTPNNAEIVNLLARAEVKLKNYTTAEFLFKKMLETYPKNHLIMTDLANCVPI